MMLHTISTMRQTTIHQTIMIMNMLPIKEALTSTNISSHIKITTGTSKWTLQLICHSMLIQLNTHMKPTVELFQLVTQLMDIMDRYLTI